MRGLNWLLVCTLLVGSVSPLALADVPPPPPPKGKKYVSIDNELLVSKDIKGYIFLESVSGFRIEGKVQRLAPSDTKPIALSKAPRRASTVVYLVPEAIAKKFKSDNDIVQAIQQNKIDEGVHAVYFSETGIIDSSDKRASVKWTTTITGVGPKGAATKVVGDGANEKFPTAYDDDTDTYASNPIRDGRVWVAGIAAGLAFVAMGLWFVRRR